MRCPALPASSHAIVSRNYFFSQPVYFCFLRLISSVRQISPVTPANGREGVRKRAPPGVSAKRRTPLEVSFGDFPQRGDFMMKRLLGRLLVPSWPGRLAVAAGLTLLLAAPALAQAGNSPWENAVNVLETAFTSTIARGLSLVAIVVAGLTFAFGEGGSKRVLAGVLFGVGMAIAAVNFLAWLFPTA
jgi:type IV secretion system protein TrbC